MPSPWVWSQSAHRYRNTRTGQFIGQAQMVGLRDAFLDAQRDAAADLAGRLASGDIPVGEWQRLMRRDVKDSFIDQYVLAHGGRGTMTQSDWGRIGAMVKEQYSYLDGFAKAIENGELSEAQIRARASMYHDASVQAYEKGHAVMMGVPTLPAYPGDGATQCHGNCRCHWDIRDAEGGWDCYWVIDPGAEHCPDCITNADRWNPLEVRP